MLKAFAQPVNGQFRGVNQRVRPVPDRLQQIALAVDSDDGAFLRSQGMSPAGFAVTALQDKPRAIQIKQLWIEMPEIVEHIQKRLRREIAVPRVQTKRNRAGQLLPRQQRHNPAQWQVVDGFEPKIL